MHKIERNSGNRRSAKSEQKRKEKGQGLNCDSEIETISHMEEFENRRENKKAKGKRGPGN